MPTKHNLSDLQRKEVNKQLEWLKRGVAEIIPEEELKRKLEKSIMTNTPLKVKLGLDPSAPDVHLGHTVVLHKLRQFQELGHEIQLVIGDFTGKIGDPTGKSKTRKQLTDEEVKQNAQTYFEQFQKVMHMDSTHIYYNSSWLKELNFVDVVTLASKTTVARMLERDDFSKRYQSNQAISIHEFFYPLMQGYDSVMLESDIELGGTDQKFNLLMGRQLQEAYEKEKQVVIMFPLLEGLDGVKKMSKSLNNYIGINEHPNDIFGKTMSIPDELMFKYFQLATSLPIDDIVKMEDKVQKGEAHPKDIKSMLAKTFVRMYHGEEEANKAESHFETVFKKGNLPDEIPEKTLSNTQDDRWIIDLLVDVGLFNTKNEARRMIKNGGVKINQEKITDSDDRITIENDMIIQVGKRKFIKIKTR